MTSLQAIARPVTTLTRARFDLSPLGLYSKLSTLPFGKQVFTRGVCVKAPYFAGINPLIEDLRPERCEVRIKKRRRVQNHLGTVHAIAMCNMAELAGGMLTEAAVPRTHRWIPTGMTVEYLAKATTDLRAIAAIDALPSFDGAGDLPVTVTIHDDHDHVVMRALITMRIAPRR